MSITIQTDSEEMEGVTNQSFRRYNKFGDGQNQSGDKADDIELLLENLRLLVLFDRLKCKGITKIKLLGSLSDEDLIEMKSSLKMLEKKRFEESFCPLVRESRHAGENRSSRETDRIVRSDEMIEDSCVIANLDIDEPVLAIYQIQLFTYDDVKLLYEGIKADLSILNNLVPEIGHNKYIHNKLLNTKDLYQDICFKLRDRMLYLESQKKDTSSASSNLSEQHGMPYLRWKSIRRMRPFSCRSVKFCNIDSSQHSTLLPHNRSDSFQEQMRREREQGSY